MDRQNKSKIIVEMEESASDYFGERPYFICTYGSHATSQNNDRSDLDMFFAMPEVLEGDPEALARMAWDFHIGKSLEIDQEVPFSNKLVATYADLEAAVALKGLTRVGDQIITPPIVKTPEFLASIEIRYRLLFNALTSPHYCSGTDVEKYAHFRAQAELMLIQLARNIMSVRLVTRGKIDDLLEALLQGQNGEEGEDYLGYKRNEETEKHLREILSREISVTLSDESMITKDLHGELVP